MSVTSGLLLCTEQPLPGRVNGARDEAAGGRRDRAARSPGTSSPIPGSDGVYLRSRSRSLVRTVVTRRRSLYRQGHLGAPAENVSSLPGKTNHPTAQASPPTTATPSKLVPAPN